MIFHWGLSESKSPQVSRTLLSILAVFNNAIFWMVSTRPPTSKSSRPFNNPLVTVPKVIIIIGIIVTFMFYSFFNPLARSRYLSLHSHSFSFILWSARTVKSTNLRIFFFCCWLFKVLFSISCNPSQGHLLRLSVGKMSDLICYKYSCILQPVLWVVTFPISLISLT